MDSSWTRQGFEQLVQSHFLPLLAGTSMVPDFQYHRKVQNLAATVSSKGGFQMALQPYAGCNYKVGIKRTFQFGEDDTKFARDFCNVVAEIDPSAAKHHLELLKDSIRKECIVRLVVRRLEVPSPAIPTAIEMVRRLFDVLDRLSRTTHEGDNISLCVGLDKSREVPAARTSDVWSLCRTDFGHLVANGVDLLLACDMEGRIAEWFDLTTIALNQDLLVPQRFLSVAAWVQVSPSHPADVPAGPRVAVLLTRNREILVITTKGLEAAYRSGDWMYYSHASIQSYISNDTSLAKSVLQTCLDASFARCGAGIAIVNDVTRLEDIMDAKAIQTGPQRSTMTFLGEIVRVRKFQRLTRAQRLSLVGTDGATVLKKDGTVFVTNAIMSVSGNKTTTGGGRKTAAMALAKHGVSIKVSSDGGITGFKKRRRNEPKASPDDDDEIKEIFTQ